MSCGRLLMTNANGSPAMSTKAAVMASVGRHPTATIIAAITGTMNEPMPLPVFNTPTARPRALENHCMIAALNGFIAPKLWPTAITTDER